MTIIKYASFDPGGSPGKKSTGIVTWNTKGLPVDILKVDQDGLDKFLQGKEETPPDVFIYETYRIYGGFSQVGSKVHTVRVIGQITAWARRHKVELIEQPSDIKGTAAKWAGIKVPQGHMPDSIAAYLHGYYYLHRLGVIPARVLERLKDD